MLIKTRPTRNPLGVSVAAALGQPDTGQLPGREPWSLNPPLDGPVLPSNRGGAVLHSIVGGNGFGAPMARIQQPDGSVRGERMPVNMDSQGNIQPIGISPESGRVQPMPQAQAHDYVAEMRAALGPRPEITKGQKIASIVAPMLLAASGNDAAAQQAIANIGARGREWDDRNRDVMLQGIKWRREDDVAAAERNQPKFLSGASDQVRYDPATGTATRVYDAPEDFETYAATKGYEPGTEGYFNAAEDYVLRGNGPTAFKYDSDLEAIRNANRISQEAARQQHRLSLRQTPTYRDTHPAPARAPAARSGSPRETLPEVSSPAEARKLPSGTRFRIKGTRQVKVVP